MACLFPRHQMWTMTHISHSKCTPRHNTLLLSWASITSRGPNTEDVGQLNRRSTWRWYYVALMLSQRHWHWFNVATTSCAQWESNIRRTSFSTGHTTLFWRWIDVDSITLLRRQWRWFNVATTSCALWEESSDYFVFFLGTRRCSDVKSTSIWRWFNVSTTSCAQWDYRVGKEVKRGRGIDVMCRPVRPRWEAGCYQFVKQATGACTPFIQGATMPSPGEYSRSYRKMPHAP